MTGFVDPPASTAPGPAGTTLRGLLRDTALLVTTLAQAGEVESVPALRQRGQALMQAMDAALQQRGIADDVREEVLYAQCGLLDEAALRHLSMDDKPLWEAQPLQVERFGKHDAGEHVFDRLAQRMREAQPNAGLLEVYSAVLALGFRGRYAREGEAARVTLMTALDARLTELQAGAEPTVFITDCPQTQWFDGLRRLSPWALAGLACAAAVLVYLFWDRALDAQLAQLLPRKP